MKKLLFLAAAAWAVSKLLESPRPTAVYAPIPDRLEGLRYGSSYDLGGARPPLPDRFA